MSEQSEREWKSYLLSKGVFANALRFAHLEKPEEVDRTSLVMLLGQNEGGGAKTR